LQKTGGVAITQKDKHQVILDHFSEHIGTYVPRDCSLNLNALGWQPRDLHHLDQMISEEEFYSVITNAPKEKAPGPDGFIGSFF
jgi:hypothetical protein